jgi:hypothetical protein
MNKYINDTKHNSETIIDLYVPVIRLLISDSVFLNDLYNCLINDILMWEPVMPRIVKADQFQQQQHKFNYFRRNSANENENFQLCKSSMARNLIDDDDVENDGDDDKSTNTKFAVNEGKRPQYTHYGELD